MFIKISLKQKENITVKQFQDIKKLGSLLGMSFKKQDLENSYFRSKDFVATSRSKIYSFLNLILIDSDIQILKLGNGKKQVYYKCWVECSGNNHNLVKQIIKRRNWITSANDYDPSSLQQQA